jgi:hypothetical protein
MTDRLPRAFVALALLACNPAPRSESASTPSDTAAGSAQAPAPGGDKREDAMSAAPPSISRNASIMEWPDSAGGSPKELRAGTNGWTCFATSPMAAGAAGRDPMCLDKEFAAFGAAWANKQKPAVKTVGIGYMLQGDAGVSNTDPFATGPTPDNQWVKSGPHVMVVLPRESQLGAFPTDPGNGGPWVMWKGTPYAHLMVPVR